MVVSPRCGRGLAPAITVPRIVGRTRQGRLGLAQCIADVIDAARLAQALKQRAARRGQSRAGIKEALKVADGGVRLAIGKQRARQQ
jgi:hypothetical protein